MKKLVASILSVTLLAVLIGGCGKTGSADSSATTKVQATADTKSEAIKTTDASTETKAKVTDTSASNGSNSGSSKTLSMWYWNGSVNPDIFDKVHKQFPDVTINAECISTDDIFQKITTTIASGGELPDILLMDDWVSSMMEYQDKFVNLYDAPYNAKNIENQYLDWKWKQAESADGNKLIALPIDIGPVCMYYRSDLFEKAGLPTDPDEVAKIMSTWDDAYATAEKLQSSLPDTKMFDFCVNIFKTTLGQAGCHVIDKDGNFIGDTEPVKTAFYEAAKGKKYVFGGSSMWDSSWGASLSNNNVAAFVSAVWMKSSLQDAAPETAGKWKVTSAPGGSGNLGGSFMGITKNCKDPETAYKVISWIQNTENQVDAFNAVGLFPSNIEAMNKTDAIMKPEDFFGGQVVNKYFVKAAEEVKAIYMPPNYGKYQDEYCSQLQLIQDQDKDVDTAWNDAVAACKQLINLQ